MDRACVCVAILKFSSLLCRPVALATRSVQVLAAALWVGSGLLYDRVTGGVQRNAPQRAKQVLDTLLLVHSADNDASHCLSDYICPD